MATVIKKSGNLCLVESDMGLTVHQGLTVDISRLTGLDDFDAVDGHFDALSSAAMTGKLYSASGRALILSSDSWRIVQDWEAAMEPA